jgi:polyhydroxyalkanoate synthesis regulator phasin
MALRTKIVAGFVASGLLVGAGLLTAVISSPGTAQAQEEPTETENRGRVSRIIGLLGDVVDDLVGDGTITQDQADAIVEATETRIDRLHEEHRGRHEQLSGFLEDGVITEAEVLELPEVDWLFNPAFDEAWEDGELTIEEIRDVRRLHRGHHLRHGLRLGALLDDGGIDQEEYDNLDDEHPLKQIDASYLEDGLITPDEFREIFSDLRGSFGKDT